MIKVNGSQLSWHRYEFGFRDKDGWLWEADSLEDAETMAAAMTGEVVMRAVYVTGWSETI